MIPFGNFSKMFRQAWAKPKFDQHVFLTFNKSIFSCEDSIDRMMQAVLTKCCKKSPDYWNLNRKKTIKSIICHRFVSTVGSVKIICERKVTCSLYLSIFFPYLSLMFSILSRGTTMKIRHLCPFCAIPAIFIAIHISITNNF